MNQENSRTEIGDLGEFGLIEHLTNSFPITQSSTVKGIGDDGAVLKMELAKQLVVSTDLLIEGIHFDLMYHPLKHLGYKAVAVNVSDLCAMNTHASQITVSIGISNRFSLQSLEELYSGIQAACKFYGVDLIGGDTTSSNKGLILSLTALGFQQAEKICYRNGAKEGDHLFVSGDLGGAFLGLQLLEREKQLYISDPKLKPDLENQTYIVGRFLKPEARNDVLFWLEKANVVPHAMIDISDGLSSDLMHICKQSETGALLQETAIPIHQDSQIMSLNFNMDPITCALNGGEDYELLMAVSPSDAEKIKFLPGFYYIGEIRPKHEGICLQTNSGNIHALQAQGWKHF